jgi:hypothetical protein
MKYNSLVRIYPEEAADYILETIRESNLEEIIKTFYTEDEILDQVGGETTFSEEEGVSKLWMEEKMGSEEIKFVLHEDCMELESENFIPEAFLSYLFRYCSDRWLEPAISAEWICEEASHIGYHFIKNNLVANDEEFYSVDEIFGLGEEFESNLDSIKDYLQVYREGLDIEKMSEDELRKKFVGLKKDSLEDWKINYWQSVAVMCEIALSGDKKVKSLQKEF